MVRISRRKINNNVLIKMYQLFFEVMTRSVKKNNFFMIMDDIFTQTEKIMVAKRITIIFLIIKRIPPRTIARTLSVSTNTVYRYLTKFDDKEAEINKVLKQMIEKEKILDFLEDVFTDIFIQPGIKKGHWEEYWNHKKTKQRKLTIGL